MNWDSPSLARISQDIASLSTVTGGINLRSQFFELGFIGGVGQNTFVSAAPTLSNVAVQSLTMPFFGGRVACNARASKRFFFRLEASYEHDIPTPQDRSSLTITSNTRLRIQTEVGLGKISSILRFTAAAIIQNAETSLGRQQSVGLQFGISLGNLWGQRGPGVQ